MCWQGCRCRLSCLFLDLLHVVLVRVTMFPSCLFVFSLPASYVHVGVDGVVGESVTVVILVCQAGCRGGRVPERQHGTWTINI